jgi:hypothetical protein
MQSMYVYVLKGVKEMGKPGERLFDAFPRAEMR